MDCSFKQKEKYIDCQIDGYWGTCGMGFGNYSPYRYGIGKSVALITYEMNKGGEQAGEQYEYYVCAECLQSEEFDNDKNDIDGHHLVKTQYIQGNTIHTINEILDKNSEKSLNYHKKHPMTKKMKKRIDHYYGIKHSDDWKKTYDDVFVKGIYD